MKTCDDESNEDDSTRRMWSDKRSSSETVKRAAAYEKRSRSENEAKDISKKNKKRKQSGHKEDEHEGWCSDPSRKLTLDQEKRVIGPENPGCVRLSEKALVGKGTREILVLDDAYLVEWAGVRKAKYVGKDAARFEAMCDAAERIREDAKDLIRLVLIKHGGNGICRRNTLRHFNEVGVVVQRTHAFN